MILSYPDDPEHEKVVAAELAGNIDKLHRWSGWAVPKKADGSSCTAGQVDGARV